MNDKGPTEKPGPFSHGVNRFIGLAIALGIMLPLAVSAQSVTDLGAQIQVLLAQISALQQQLDSATPTNTVQVVPAPPAAPTPSSCPNFFRNLSRGASGQDVLSLQEFLIAQGHLSPSSNSGFFGPLTEIALQRWQSAKGIISTGDPDSTGYGVVGPRTRALIALNCNAGPTLTPTTNYPTPVRTCMVAPPPLASCSSGWQAQRDSNGCTTSYQCSIPLPLPIPQPTPVGSSALVAFPTSGASPLIVTFTSIQASTFQGIVSFGDGASAQVSASACTSSYPASCTYSVSHSYSANGSFISSLIQTNAATSSNLIGTATINVGAPSQTPSLSIAESPASVAYGQSVAISWASQNGGTDSAVALYLVQTSGVSQGVIGTGKSASGSMNWTIPSSYNGCADCPTLQSPPPSGMYVIAARLYTPSGAWISGYPPQNPIYPTFLASASSSAFSITAQ